MSVNLSMYERYMSMQNAGLALWNMEESGFGIGEEQVKRR
jgi:hypothetical protein